MQIYAINEFTYLNRFFSLNIILNTEIVTNIREVKNYWQVISQLGGLLGVLTAINTIICKYFSNKFLLEDLIDHLFK